MGDLPHSLLQLQHAFFWFLPFLACEKSFSAQAMESE